MAKPNKTDETTIVSQEHDHEDDFHLYDEAFQQKGIERAVSAESPNLDSPQEFNLDDGFLGGDSFRGLPILTLDEVVGQLDSGFRLPGVDDGVITYTFFNGQNGYGWLAAGHFPGRFRDENGDKYDIRGGEGMTRFGPDQEAAARFAVEMWDDLIAAQFVEVQGHGSGNADIVFANTLEAGQAFAYYPGEIPGWWDAYRADVFVQDPSTNWTNAWFTNGGYGNTTLVHEIGHSMGLSHPGNYNGFATYVPDAEYAQDSLQYTIMSYFGAEETDWYTSGRTLVDWTTLYFHNPQTPQIHDIYAIQQIYGADTETRSGDTTYGFNVTDDITLWVHDFEQNPYPYMSIYDAGGEDTIDASGFSASQYINLNPGSFSSIGDGAPDAELVNANRDIMAEYYAPAAAEFSQAFLDSLAARYAGFNELEIRLDTGVAGIFASNYQNVGIAYGTTIENAIGGSARDLIEGNDVGNMLDGRAGNDVIIGNGGDDIIIGGLGIDEMTGGEGADTFVLDNLDVADIITDFNGADGDMLDLSGIADLLGTDLTLIDGDFSGAAGEVRYDGVYLEVSAGGDTEADYTVVMANGADLDASMMALAMSA